MLPYHSFSEGRLEGGSLELQFGDLVVVIEGEELDELWEGLQLQDVRLIRVIANGSPSDGECCVRRLSIRNVAATASQ